MKWARGNGTAFAERSVREGLLPPPLPAAPLFARGDHHDPHPRPESTVAFCNDRCKKHGTTSLGRAPGDSPWGTPSHRHAALCGARRAARAPVDDGRYPRPAPPGAVARRYRQQSCASGMGEHRRATPAEVPGRLHRRHLERQRRRPPQRPPRQQPPRGEPRGGRHQQSRSDGDGLCLGAIPRPRHRSHRQREPPRIALDRRPPRRRLVRSRRHRHDHNLDVTLGLRPDHRHVKDQSPPADQRHHRLDRRLRDLWSRCHPQCRPPRACRRTDADERRRAAPLQHHRPRQRQRRPRRGRFQALPRR